MRYTVYTTDDELIMTTNDRQEAEAWVDRRPGERYAVDADGDRYYAGLGWKAA